MAYKRYPHFFRRYPLSGTNQTSSVTADSGTLKVTKRIPLPNEAEDTPEKPKESRLGHMPSFLDFFTKHIQIDEIILIGLILLLFAEGLEDDIVIILLLYILLTGRG